MNFNELKKEYLEKLKENVDIFNTVIFNSGNILKIVFDPSTEEEIKLANLILNFINDIKVMSENACNLNINEEYIKNSLIVNLYINCINALKNNDNERINEIKDDLNQINSDEAAMIIFDICTIFFNNYDDVLTIISRNSGFDIDQYITYVAFMNYMNLATEITNSRNIMDIDKLNEKNKKFLMETLINLHTIVEEKINKKVK